MPAISVVVPARDAATTITETLESLVAQSEPSFEAVVVDDGSSDATAALALAFAERDSRFRVLRQDARGVSAARNAGLAEARGEWLLFLDADDLIEPDALRLLLARARQPDAPDAVVCGWARLAPDGTRVAQPLWDKPNQAFDCFATSCVVTIHSCLVRRALILSAGGFDESLVTCEDWDLWQRVARAGARFVVVDACLALYRMRPGAASSAGRRLLPDALEVIGRGHGPNGRDPALLPQTQLGCACYAAGLTIGAGDDARPLLDALDWDGNPAIGADAAAACLVDALGLPRCLAPRDLCDLWPDVEPRLRAFLEELERRLVPGFARRAQRLIEAMVVERAGDRLPLTVGSTHGLCVDVSRPVEDVHLGAEIDRLVCVAQHDDEALGRVDLPVCDGTVPARVLADALAAEVFWPLLCRFLDCEDATAWELFVEELWGPAQGGAVFAAAGWTTVEVSEELRDVRVHRRVLNVEVTAGGAPVGVVRVPARRGCVPAHELRAAITDECGLELAIVAVREALVERPLPRGVPLRELLRAAAAREPDPLMDERTLVIPRWNGRVRAPAARRAALPLEAVADVAAAAGSMLMLGHAPTRALYEPAIHARHGTGTDTAPGEGAVGGQGTEAWTSQLPILMYHRIADPGSCALRRYRLDPSAFDEQLHYLREHGYRGVTLGEWLEAGRARRPLPGRALLLTFDDGYADFADEAWPLLERHGFPATVFVVAGMVGTRSAWDAGDAAPLMGWQDIAELSRRGVEFGSHTCTHATLCGLSNADVVRELVTSRALLEEKLGKPVSALAYPYGEFDRAVAHLAGACGYSAALTDVPRHARLIDGPLTLPRHEIRGDFALGDLERTLSPE